jgi:hypothetical protein
MHGFHMHEGQSVLAVVDSQYIIPFQSLTKYVNVNDLFFRNNEQDIICNNYVQLAVQIFY